MQFQKKADTIKAVDPKLTELENLSEESFDLAKELIGKEYDVLEAENDLENQTTAGGAQLKAIKLNEAKEAFKKIEKEFDDSLRVLKSKEDDLKKSGGLKSNLTWKQYAPLISKFKSNGHKVIFDLMLERKYKGYTDKHKDLFGSYLKFRYAYSLESLEYPPLNQ